MQQLKLANRLVNYKCTKCNYRFSRKVTMRFNSCPYCGRADSWQVDSGNLASDILAEVAELDL
jgi:Zn finger protein HypA/HybF involved in hydrogenase expression